MWLCSKSAGGSLLLGMPPRMRKHRHGDLGRYICASSPWRNMIPQQVLAFCEWWELFWVPVFVGDRENYIHYNNFVCICSCIDFLKGNPYTQGSMPYGHALMDWFVVTYPSSKQTVKVHVIQGHERCAIFKKGHFSIPPASVQKDIEIICSKGNIQSPIISIKAIVPRDRILILENAASLTVLYSMNIYFGWISKGATSSNTHPSGGQCTKG